MGTGPPGVPGVPSVAMPAEINAEWRTCCVNPGWVGPECERARCCFEQYDAAQSGEFGYTGLLEPPSFMMAPLVLGVLAGVPLTG